MNGREERNRQVRAAAGMTIAFAFGLVFGVILLVDGDWIPGAIIVAAALVGLAAQIPVIRRLRSKGPRPSPPRSSPTG